MKTILIVDDHQESLYMLEFLLKSNGFGVEKASNGAQALLIALKNPPDMIVTDILMPEMDGYVLCREWMKNERLKRVPFIFYTATYTDPRDEELALNLGAAKFILKPREPDEFLQIIKDIIDKYKRGKAPPVKEPVKSDTIFLKEYNQALIRKLESKMLDLEKANQALIQEIKEREQTETALRRSEEKYQMLVEQASDGIFSLELDGHIVDGNSAGCKMLGYSYKEIIQLNIKELITEKSLKETPLRIDELKQGKVVVIEREAYRKDGTIFPVEVSAKILPNGLMQGILRDITKRKKNEAYIRASLEEKRVLLKEIHHRVKNNLQIIISLLELQAAKLKNNQAIEAFCQTKNRVYSMALVHDKLYRSEDFSQIDFCDFLATIAHQLFQVYDKERRISFEPDIQQIYLNVDTAIPCGLIANELLTNALEHAFPENRQGKINISFREKNQQTYELIVRDNGVGFPGHINESESVGLQLVKGLVDQIDGTIEVKKESQGTKVIVEFHLPSSW